MSQVFIVAALVLASECFVTFEPLFNHVRLSLELKRTEVDVSEFILN